MAALHLGISMLSVGANPRNEIFAFPVILFVIIRALNIRPKPF